MANPLISGRSILCPIIISCILMVGQAFCQTYPSNEQLLADAVAGAASRLLDSLKFEPGSVHIMPVPNLDAVASEGAKSAFLKAGWSIVSSPDSSAKDFLTAEVRLSAFHFEYVKGDSRGFWKRPLIKRHLTGQMVMNLSGRNNFIGFRDFSFEDQIPYGQENIVASPRYNQLAPESPRLGSSRFLEPIAVGVTVGGLIYLFFASR